MDQKTIFTNMALKAWQQQVDRTSKFISELSDEQLMKEIAPGKNRVVYLVGHLAGIHDAFPEILGLGKRTYPELQSIFLDAPDKSIEKIPTVSELRIIWTAVHDRLKNEFAKMSPEDWFKRHESMTDEDFEKDPARNKLSVLLTRTNHLAYHFGQMRLLK
jgi:DinB superfamily